MNSTLPTPCHACPRRWFSPAKLRRRWGNRDARQRRLGLLVEIVIGGNFEEARETLMLPDGIDVHLDAELSDHYQTMLRDAREAARDERRL